MPSAKLLKIRCNVLKKKCVHLTYSYLFLHFIQGLCEKDNFPLDYTRFFLISINFGMTILKRYSISYPPICINVFRKTTGLTANARAQKKRIN